MTLLNCFISAVFGGLASVGSKFAFDSEHTQRVTGPFWFWVPHDLSHLFLLLVAVHLRF
jgi:hypothetical protein